jgi:ATP synthase protein I
MPFEQPTPGPKSSGKSSDPESASPRSSSLVDSIAQGERMVQIAFVLPCAGFIGWLIGAWLGRHFHQLWMPMAGIVFGIVAGLIGAVRMAIAASDSTAAKSGKGDLGGRP